MYAVESTQKFRGPDSCSRAGRALTAHEGRIQDVPSDWIRILEFTHAQPINEDLNDVHWIVLRHVIFDVLGQQQFLISRFSFDLGHNWLVKSMSRI